MIDMKQNFLRSVLALSASIVMVTSVVAGVPPFCSSEAFGYGQRATGGGNATPTLVSSVSELSAAFDKSSTPKVIIITRSLTFNSMLTVQDCSNKTLLALPGVTLTSLETDSKSSGILYFKRCDNIIIRNLTLIGPGAYDVDGNDLLCFDGVTNSWVDHCDFQDGLDGNFDNKNNTDDVTVSWCRFRYRKAPIPGGSGGSDDHRFSNLLGSSSTNAPEDGTFNMTWAYCWWDNGCKQRMLRMRNASIHFLGCYWDSNVADYYIGPENADAYVELGTFAGGTDWTNVVRPFNGSSNGFRWVKCESDFELPTYTNRQVVYPYNTYSIDNMFTSAADARTAVTDECGAGATLSVTTAGVVSSTCDKEGGNTGGGGSGNTETKTISFSMTMPEESIPGSLADMVVEGGYLVDASTDAAKKLTYSESGVKFNGGKTSILEIQLDGYIQVGTTLRVHYTASAFGTDRWTGLAVLDGDMQNPVIDKTGIAGSEIGTVSYTFSALDESYIGQKTLYMTRNGGTSGISVDGIWIDNLVRRIVTDSPATEEVETAVRKELRNGTLVIRRGGRTYSLTGVLY